ncbi:hypothetical protein acsn021_03900 [Anaerocolumna cellulosilytica]|uniref:Phage-Barnase-EndoU-ColicinE5/D-RelE like nuclease 4 domain-containing protein n=1 Tax=Anaerocolumna cellulosilytica TaxID=433286 RepID=A0A6S6R0Q9_9FIRM|nr:PBECR4 domain-containing protein [Anaerocolumna cellulosilytica]MBB5197379.1 hypothetical protein [Anaerocolumna cellulosilytica]BCJ92821.1 hypothetical protein acsn021_03900 [Anaerocolumna cellulosilytica]
MYSAIELHEVEEKPRISDITMAVLQQYYEIYLMPFIFEYTVTYENGSEKMLQLRFDEDNFCHLLGVESIAKKAVKFSMLAEYRGKKGWDNVKNGVITFACLKKLNQRQFKNVKAKYVYFYLMPNMISNPLAINYKRDLVDPETNIECEIMFYSYCENAVIHLGIEYSEDKGYYIARSFFVEKLSNDNPVDNYIKNQENISADLKAKVIML